MGPVKAGLWQFCLATIALLKSILPLAGRIAPRFNGIDNVKFIVALPFFEVLNFHKFLLVTDIFYGVRHLRISLSGFLC